MNFNKKEPAFYQQKESPNPVNDKEVHIVLIHRTFIKNKNLLLFFLWSIYSLTSASSPVTEIVINKASRRNPLIILQLIEKKHYTKNTQWRIRTIWDKQATLPVYCCFQPALLRCHNTTIATCSPQESASSAYYSNPTNSQHLPTPNDQAEHGTSALASSLYDFPLPT